MVPRTEIIGIEIGETVNNLKDLFTTTGLSKILVYKNNMDDVVGYVHSFALFKKPKTIKSVILPVEFVPETMLANDVLNVLIKKSKSIAIVLDEYGGTSGLMTVEDIVEELFGEIEDEHEHEAIERIEEKLSDDHFKFSARLEVDYLNDTYKLDLPENENYETLGGLIVDSTEEIPLQNEEVVVENFKFTILEVSNTKIDLVELKILDSD
jgi:CBS domain containing-hemolysin-like protein